MKNVMQQTDNLIEAIHASSEYTQYQMLQNAVAKDEGIYGRLNEYRRRNFEIQMNDQIDTIEASSNLSREYEDVLLRSDVKDFLAAEQRYIKMIRNINRKLDSQINVNIDFM